MLYKQAKIQTIHDSGRASCKGCVVEVRLAKSWAYGECRPIAVANDGVELDGGRNALAKVDS
jgi:hypothetical protein